MSFRIDIGSPLSDAMFFVALFGLCAAYLQGALVKLMDFPSAVAEMTSFRLNPPALFAVMVIALELVAPTMILTGILRWVGALALAGFTLLSTLIALRFWQKPLRTDRRAAANAFFEHLGLVGGFLLVTWLDLTGNYL